MTGPPRTAVITGITGQDGAYLAELLLEKGYRVVGVTRRTPAVAAEQLGDLVGRVELQMADVRDERALARVLRDATPHEVYHLASQSLVHASWEHPVATAEVTAVGALRLLEAVRTDAPSARVLVASSSEIFGRPEQAPQCETTPIRPATPYGVSKSFAFWTTAVYRESRGLFAASAILFNHESPRRGPEFVTRKITSGVARIAAGRASSLNLGNLESRRDWGFAGDYVEAMWRILQQDTPDDFVVGTGETHSVREFCEAAFRAAGLDYLHHVVQDEKLFRPVDSQQIVADPARARERLGWTPKVKFTELVEMMVHADLQRVREGAV
jgi:GDPmannose 4,6-dehydratase